MPDQLLDPDGEIASIGRMIIALITTIIPATALLSWGFTKQLQMLVRSGDARQPGLLVKRKPELVERVYLDSGRIHAASSEPVRIVGHLSGR